MVAKTVKAVEVRNDHPLCEGHVDEDDEAIERDVTHPTGGYAHYGCKCEGCK